MDLSLLDKFSPEEIKKIIEALDITTNHNKKQLEPELIREIEPIERWVNNPYYTGKDGLKLYKFWKDALIEIFGTHKGQYNEIIIEGGLGCRPLCSYINTSCGKLTYNQLIEIANSDKKELKKINILSDTGSLPIKSVGSVGEKQTLIITLSDGYNIICSEDHKLRVVRDNKIDWCYAKDLKQFDFVLRSYKKDKVFLPNNNKFDNKDYWYLLCCIIHGVVYTSKHDILCCRIKNKNNDVIEYIKSILKNKKIKFYSTKSTIKFDATLFKDDIDKLNIKVNRPESFTTSLFDSGLFCFNEELTENNIKSFLTCLLDFGYINEYPNEKSSLQIMFRNETLAREFQSLFFSLGIPCELNHTILCKRHLYSEKELINKNFSTTLSFKNLMAISKLSKWNIKNTEINDFVKAKLKVYYNPNLKNLKGPLFVGEHVIDISENLREYCKRKNIEIEGSIKSLINRKIIHTTFLDLFKKDARFNFSDDILDYIYNNQCLKTQIVSIKKGDVVECGDITVAGNPVYINDGIINHNCGKSTVGMYILIRKLYELSCYKNIPALFDLMASANIVFMYFSLTKQQAELTGFKQFRETVDSIPYFQEEFCRNMRHSSILEFPENVIFRHGARLTDQIGSNLIATIMDEANFFNHNGQATADAGALSAIQTLHTSVLNRGASRFMSNGVNSSISVLISSPTYSSSYTQQRIEASIGNPHARVFRCRLWDCKPEKYSKECFNVFLGNEKVDPFIIRDVEDLNNALEAEMCPRYEGRNLAEGIQTMPPRMKEKIDFIPIDFKARFETDLLQSIMDIAGYSVAPTGRLFSSRKIWNNCISNNIPELFYKNELSITTEDDSESNSLEFFLKDKSKFPDSHLSHYIHIDQSYAHDSTGFAICHRGESVLKNGSLMPTIVLDCAIRINPPPPPKKISIARVRSFIFYCIKNLKLNVAKVTYDSFSSAESIQTLKENGVNAEMQSVDRTDDAYLGFIDLLYDNRVLFNKMDADLMATEIFELVHYRERHKVDHQPNGCFSGNTKIKVSGEGNYAIRDLVGRENFYSFGIDESNNIIEVPIKKVWKVKEEDKISKVRILNNGDGQITEVVCTRNHLFKLKSGEYVEACSLKTGAYLAGFGQHTVAGVLNYTSLYPIEVFDMESPMTSNYCLGNGVIVHNSKDVMDAVVGCIHSAIQDKDSEFQTPKQLSAGLKGNYDNYIDEEDIFSQDELLAGYPYR